MRKTVLLLVSLLMATALVLSACTSTEETGPTEGTTVTGEVTTPTTPTTPELPEASVEVDAPTEEEPKYGGTLRILMSEVQNWDPIRGQIYEQTLPIMSKLITLDWWKGPAGTGEWKFENANVWPREHIYTGDLLESWDASDPLHITQHLKQGVMWHNKSADLPAREVTADDVVWTYEKLLDTPTTVLAQQIKNDANVWTFEAIDRYTIVHTHTIPSAYYPVQLATQYPIVRHEVYELYEDMTNWHNVTGSGAFILEDFVAGSSVTYEKNPNWHMKDPEGRSLPYIDGMTMLIIPDVDTQLTALRSGQIDIINGYSSVSYVNAESMLETNPELQFLKKASNTITFVLFDMKAPPFGPNGDEDAFKVRKAAHMAIDFDSLVNDYYEGNALMVTSSMIPSLSFGELEVENLPPESQELFSYNPERAKELLAEAGYPNGIKIDLTTGWETEISSIIMAWWDAIGIEVEIKTTDIAGLYAQLYGYKIKDAFLVGWGTAAEEGWRYAYYLNEDTGERARMSGNFSDVNDPVINEIQTRLEHELDYDKRLDLMIEMQKAHIAGAYEIDLPLPATYNFWQPWVRGYHGEEHGAMFSPKDIAAYIWIDDSFK